MMPGMDGFELIARVRAEAAVASTAAIVLSSAGRPEDRARCASLGVHACLIKPVRQSDLQDALTDALAPRAAAPDAPRVAAPPAPAPAPAAADGRRILLAEDNVINQKLAVHMLTRMGHSVVVAADGRKAVEAFQAERFDLVLMDVQMPEMDGFEALAVIKSLPTGGRPRVPIISLTAHAMKGDRERCLAAGFDGYLSKPIRSAELNEAIDALTSRPPAPDDPEEPDDLLERCVSVGVLASPSEGPRA